MGRNNLPCKWEEIIIFVHRKKLIFVLMGRNNNPFIMGRSDTSCK